MGRVTKSSHYLKKVQKRKGGMYKNGKYDTGSEGLNSQ